VYVYKVCVFWCVCVLCACCVCLYMCMWCVRMWHVCGVVCVRGMCVVCAYVACVWLGESLCDVRVCVTIVLVCVYQG